MNNGSQPMTIALPKGRMNVEVQGMLRDAGLPAADLYGGRLLVETDGVRYLLARPSDVVTYVREGVADLGITGKDILMENPGGYYELVDLQVGRCSLAVAGPMPADSWPAFLVDRGDRLRVATKHPRASRDFFAGMGVSPAVIGLGGALELAPQVGLTDVIVDLVQTGRTLQANGLEYLEEIAPSTARLIAHPVSLRFRTDQVDSLLAELRRVLKKNGVPGSAPLGGGTDAHR